MSTNPKETTARSPSVGAGGGQPSKTYTPISAETADRFRSDPSLKPRCATVATIATVFLGAAILSSHRRGGEKGGRDWLPGTRENQV